MTFSNSSLHDVYETLTRRKSDVGGIELLEFDDDEYDALLYLGRQIVQEEKRSKESRLVFLALAIAHARRHNLTTEEAFWDKFEDVLGLEHNEKRFFITLTLLWKAYSDEGIKKKRGEQTRRYVGTLLRVALEDSRLHRNQLLSFFEWYYETDPDRTVDESLVRQYAQMTGTKLDLFHASLPSLEHHCHLLRDVLDYAIGEELFLRDVDYDTYRQTIREGLGDKYDLDQYHLLNQPDALKKVVVRLENHRTPRQFRTELKKVSQAAKVQLPDGREHEVTFTRRLEKLTYGRYLVGDDVFRVVPMPWLRLRSIGNWDLEKLVPLRRRGYVGYRKNEHFLVQRGHKEEESRVCYLRDHKKTHIWAGPVKPGRPLSIDGNPVDGSTGVSPWSIDLQLGQNDEDTWVMRFVIPRLDVFKPEHAGSKLEIVYHDQRHVYTLDPDGIRSLRRSASFVVDPTANTSTVKLLLDGELIDQKTKRLASAYLFTATSYGRIPAGTERSWGDRHYYLFTRHPDALQICEGVEVIHLNISFGKYEILEVRWSDPSEPFFLACEGCSWKFERNRYYLIESHLLRRSKSHFEFKAHQVCNLSDVRFNIQTNHPLHANVRLEVSFGKDSDMLGEFTLSCPDRIPSNLLKTLDKRREGRTGAVRFYFYFDKHLIASQQLTVLPTIEIEDSSPTDALHVVGRSFPVRVRADEMVLWDSETAVRTSLLTVDCTPNVSIDASRDRYPPGIHERTPRSVRKRLFLPDLGEFFYLRFTPNIFGVWIFEKSGGSYQNVQALNYYRLKQSALLVKSTPKTHVCLYASPSNPSVQVWGEKTSEKGSLVIEDLSFLSSQCEEEHSQFIVESKSRQVPICVRWAPRLHDSSVEKTTVNVCASGPPNTELIVVWNSEDEVPSEQVIRCRGKQFNESCTAGGLNTASEVLLQFRCAGGERRTAKRYRLTTRRSSPSFPKDWVYQGVGLSGQHLLTSR